MNPEEIKLILEKYYNGETSLEEEKMLKQFFMQDDIPSEFSDEKEIFRYYVDSSHGSEPSVEFEKDILSALDREEKSSASFRSRKIFIVMAGIAAGLIIMSGSYFFFLSKKQPQDTFNDPELAYYETIKILNEVSVRLNKGTRSLGQISNLRRETLKSIETVNKSTSIIAETMKPINNMLESIEEISNKKEENK